MLRLARDPLDPLLGRAMLINGLAHLRGHQPPRIDREGELYSDGPLILIEGRAAGGHAVGEGIDAVAGCLVAAADEVERREMTAARGTDVFARDVGGQTARHER